MESYEDILKQYNFNQSSPNAIDYGSYVSQGEDGREAFFRAVEKALPPVFSRETASRTIGGLISAKSMCNADSLGIGPVGKVRVGSKIGYTRESFMVWLRGRVR